MKQVRIISKDPDIDITVDMGNGPATLVGGLGGWEVIQRVNDLSATVWNGQEPLMQDIPVLLDGWEKERSVERELNTLFKLSRDFDNKDREAPPVFKVFGPIHYEGKNWVLPEGGIELNTEDAIRLQDGTLVRQPLTLHLLEYVKPEVIRRRRKPKKHGKLKGGVRDVNPKTKGGGRPVTKDGDTLQKVAARHLGDWKRWPELARTSGIKDPFEPLAGGRDLLIGGPGQSAGRNRLILNDYGRFALWANRHGYGSLATGPFGALLETYAENQGVDPGRMYYLHGSVHAPDSWYERWNEEDH